MIPNNIQLLLKDHLAWFNTTIQLFHSVIDVLKGTLSDCRLKRMLDPNITWLEKTSAICWNIMNVNPWVGTIHPMVEFC